MTTSSALAGRVALVTGGGGGIGEAACVALAGLGAGVAVLDRDAGAAESVAAALRERGGEAVAIGCDVADPTSVDAAVSRVVEGLGGLDIAVNNAGTGLPATRTADLTDEDWRRVMAVNLDGVFFCMRAEIGVMQARGAGSIVNVSSILGAAGSDSGSSAYTASKHGVVGLTRNAALEYARDGIRINAVGPGYVSTPLAARMMTEDLRARREQETPMGRLAAPGEIASLIAWLAGDGASFVTGAYYAADGGYLAR